MASASTTLSAALANAGIAASRHRLRSLTPPRGVEDLPLPTPEVSGNPTRLRSLTPPRCREEERIAQDRRRSLPVPASPAPTFFTEAWRCSPSSEGIFSRSPGSTSAFPSSAPSSPRPASPWRSPSFRATFPNSAGPTTKGGKSAFDGLFMVKAVQLPPPKIEFSSESLADLPQFGPDFPLPFGGEEFLARGHFSELTTLGFDSERKDGRAKQENGIDECRATPSKPSLPKRMPRKWRPPPSGTSHSHASESSCYSSPESRSLPGTPAAVSSESLNSLKGPYAESDCDPSPCWTAPASPAQREVPSPTMPTFPAPVGLRLSGRGSEEGQNVVTASSAPRVALDRAKARAPHDSARSAAAGFTCWLRDDDLQHDLLGGGFDSIREEEPDEGEPRQSVLDDILPWRPRASLNKWW